MHIALNCVVQRDQQAILDSAHRISIGYETYFVSSQTAKKSFEKNPLRYCGFLTDPVTKQLFRPSESSPRDTNNGRPWYFASDSTRMMFAMMPESYRDPSYRMLPREDTTAH
jgi:YHS domain-containing protein